MIGCARSLCRESCLRLDASLEADRRREERLGRLVERRRRGLRWTETGRLSCLHDEERWWWDRDRLDDDGGGCGRSEGGGG